MKPALKSAVSRRAMLFLAALLVAAMPTLATPESELISAAQREDLTTVQRLLDAGVDVDTRSRYGATALFFACDKANVELVNLLLDRGADPEIEDSFYGATALGWAQGGLTDSADHRDIVLALVQHLREEGEDLDSLFLAAVEADDLELVRAVLDRKRVSTRGLQAASALAATRGFDALDALLRPLAPAAEEAAVLSPERLAEITGSYRNAEYDVTLKLSKEEDGAYTLRSPGADDKILFPMNAHTFSVRGSADLTISFEPPSGLSERLVWKNGSREFSFERVVTPPASDTDAPEVVSEKMAVASPEPSAPLAEPLAKRTAARPWPEFRGLDRSGNADGQGVPTTWDGATGTHVAWQTPIPGLGLASPVIWGDRVFVATAVSEDGDDRLKTGLYGDVASVEDDSVQVWKVLALSLEDGTVEWEREAARGTPKVRRHLKSSHASPTPAIDADHVVVSFGSAGLFCYDHRGQLRWKKDLGTLSAGWFYDPTYEWEFGSSPILWKGKVLVQVDISGESFVAAYDAASGKELWKTDRDEISSWGTPVVLPSAEGPDELITNAPTIRGYDVDTGAELWTLSPNSEVTVASPVLGENRVFVTGGYPPARPIYAIHPGGRGSLDLEKGTTSSPTIPWSVERGGTYIPTPIVYRGRLYVLHNNGRLVSYDATTGTEIYKARVGHSESYSASPIAADGRIFFSSEDGTTTVVKAGDTYEVLATNELGEILMTTPAASNGMLVLRGHEHLFGIAAPSAPTKSR